MFFITEIHSGRFKAVIFPVVGGKKNFRAFPPQQTASDTNRILYLYAICILFRISFSAMVPNDLILSFLRILIYVSMMVFLTNTGVDIDARCLKSYPS